MVHTIRLHGPWNVLSASSSPKHLPSKVKLPNGWAAFFERIHPEGLQKKEIRLERRFGYPTGISPDQKIWLVLKTKGISASVSLNDQTVGTLNDDCMRYDVSNLLQPRNGLLLAISAPEGDAGIFEFIQLEIEGE